MEVLSKLIEKQLTDSSSLEFLLKSVYCKHIYQPDDEINSIAAGLSIYKKSHNLSMGDKYCLALGKKLNLPVYTADRIWLSLNDALGIEIILIRE